eukprot:TRINITY_DN11077_c0_g1_i1.p1 TRINITY_DN11077_c0_g1~~TRINITY_DN11077_c0_g1_i1.p1  ORF type:complete len:169 (-),score=24.87 TRINITY_DN11077_c0_g1_i1:10-516(-)
MRIVDTNNTLITNYEVYNIMLESRDKQQEPSKSDDQNTKQRHKEVTDWENKFRKYLHAFERGGDIQQHIALRDYLRNWNFTPAEILQVSNLKPTHMVELHMILEEAEERLDDAQLAEVLQTIATHVPPPQPSSEKEKSFDQETADKPEKQAQVTPEERKSGKEEETSA